LGLGVQESFPEEVTFKPSIQELGGKLIPGGEEGIVEASGRRERGALRE